MRNLRKYSTERKIAIFDLNDIDLNLDQTARLKMPIVGSCHIATNSGLLKEESGLKILL